MTFLQSSFGTICTMYLDAYFKNVFIIILGYQIQVG